MSVFHRVGVYRFVWAGLLGILMQGCASYGSVAITCPMIKMESVTDRDSRVTSRGVSVLPPNIGLWCQNPYVPSGVVFGTSTVLGKNLRYLDSRNIPHTFAVIAIAINSGSEEITSEEELARFVTDWIDRGQKVKFVEDVAKFDFSADPRIKTLENQVQARRSTEAICVDYRAEYEETDNPLKPTAVLKLSNEGYVCRHPDSNSVLVQVELSERRQVGDENVRLAESLRRRAEPTFRSLRFLPL